MVALCGVELLVSPRVHYVAPLSHFDNVQTYGLVNREEDPRILIRRTGFALSISTYLQCK